MSVRQYLTAWSPVIVLTVVAFLAVPVVGATTPLHQHQTQQITDQFATQMTHLSEQGHPSALPPGAKTSPTRDITDPANDPDCELYTDPTIWPECSTDPMIWPECESYTDPVYWYDCSTDPMLWPECSTDPLMWPECDTFTDPAMWPECETFTDPMMWPECSTDPAVWPECGLTDPAIMPECSTDPTIWPECAITNPMFFPECSTDPDLWPECAVTNPMFSPECSTDPDVWPNECATQDANDEPQTFRLMQNVPNPFNPVTHISFVLNETQQASLTVYSINGQVVEVLADGVMAIGEHRVRFDGHQLSSGMYIYELRTATERITMKMLLVR